MRVEFCRNNLGRWISGCEGGGLAARGGAAIEESGPSSDERGNQLRSFVLNEDAPFTESAGLRDIAGGDDPGGGQQCAGRQADAHAF